MSDEEGNVYERNNYYPFGLRWGVGSDLGSNRYRFNGKEEQSVFGVPYIDYGARQYDPLVARWSAPDPLSEKYYGISPYAYCANDPVNFVDLDGRALGNYYLCSGDFIISDGIDDGKLYIVDVDKYNEYTNKSTNNDILLPYLKINSIEVDGIIVVSRDRYTSDFTQGEFEVIGENGFSGYTMERPGPPTSISGLSRPIPNGLYDTYPRENLFSGSFAFRIFNDTVPISRGILGHVGNTADDSTGCILFGLTKATDGFISRSRDAMDAFGQFYKGKSTVKLIVR